MISIAQHAWQNILAVGATVLIATSEPAAPGRDLSVWYLWGFLFVLILVPSLVRYLPFRYRLGDSELHIRSGWLFRQERSIPYQRIQGLDTQAGPFHRIFDTVGVTIETGGGVEDDGKLDAISRDAFEEMRELVFGRSAAAEPGSGASPAEGVTIVQLSRSETLLAGSILGREMLLVAGIVGAIYELGLGNRLIEWLLDDRTDVPGTMRGILRAAELGQLTISSVALLLSVVLVLVIVIRLVSVVLTAQRFWDYRLEGFGDDLRVTCGLLSRNTSITPIQRIQTLTVREGPWHRLSGRVTVAVATAGGVMLTQSQPSRETLAPVIRNERLDELLSIALRGLRLPGDGWHGVAPGAVARYLRVRAVLFAVFTALALLRSTTAGVLAACVLLLVMLVGAMRLRRFRWNAFDDGFAIRRGWIWREMILVRNDRIQLGEFTESPFDRRWGMATVKIDTAGRAAPRITLRYLRRADARELVARIDRIVAATPSSL